MPSPAKLEIDEQTRELRAGGRSATPQPRVFDLIVYLARHRDRVVPKDELLDKLWPGVVVTDASLQRAVSLARTACARLGAADAIRNYARQGYRFMVDGAGQLPRGAAEDATPPVSSELLQARASYVAGEWQDVVDRLQAIEFSEGLCAADLQRWAHAAQCVGWEPQVALPLERAVATYTARGDALRAGWLAVLLSQSHLEHRDALAAKGWLHRAERLLENFPESREYGYLSYLQARVGHASNAFEPALAAARRAHEAGRRHSDPDLEYLGLLFAGEVTLTLGRIEEGLALLDEAGIAVRSSNLSPLTGSIIYCGVISTCMIRADWERAGRWVELFRGWCGEHGPHAVPGICRLHQAEVLYVRGDLSDAFREVEEARVALASRSRWVEGEAWRVLGEIHYGRGETDAAEAAFHRAHEQGWDTQPGLALLELERGRPAQALRLIVRGLDERHWSSLQRRGLLLAHCTIIAAHAGDRDRARWALAELDANPQLWSTSALRALVTSARGEVAALENNAADAISHLRTAVQQWHAIESPLPAARARYRLAELLSSEGDHAAADRELSVAESAFKDAGATTLAARCRQLRKKLSRSA